MEVQAKAPRKKCLTESCRTLIIKTDNEEQQAFLAVLHAAFIEGGELMVISGGRKGRKKRKGTLKLPGMSYFDKEKAVIDPKVIYHCWRCGGILKNMEVEVDNTITGSCENCHCRVMADENPE